MPILRRNGPGAKIGAGDGRLVRGVGRKHRRAGSRGPGLEAAAAENAPAGGRLPKGVLLSKIDGAEEGISF